MGSLHFVCDTMALLHTIFLSVLCSTWMLVCAQDCAAMHEPCMWELGVTCCPGTACTWIGADYYACVMTGDPGQECQAFDQLCDPLHPPCCEGLKCDYYGICEKTNMIKN